MNYAKLGKSIERANYFCKIFAEMNILSDDDCISLVFPRKALDIT